METWQAIIKEIGNKELLKPMWVSSQFDYIKDDKQRESVTRNHLEKFWGLRDDGVEWYTLERIDDNNKQVNQVTAFMLYIYNKWCIGESKKVFGNNLGEHEDEDDDDDYQAYGNITFDCLYNLVHRTHLQAMVS